MLPSTKRIRICQQGFSLLEMLFATVILLVGLVAVAQLIPASVLLNYHNRTDSSALVFAQRQLDILLDQPLNPRPERKHVSAWRPERAECRARRQCCGHQRVYRHRFRELREPSSPGLPDQRLRFHVSRSDGP